MATRRCCPAPWCPGNHRRHAAPRRDALTVPAQRPQKALAEPVPPPAKTRPARTDHHRARQAGRRCAYNRGSTGTEERAMPGGRFPASRFPGAASTTPGPGRRRVPRGAAVPMALPGVVQARCLLFRGSCRSLPVALRDRHSIITRRPALPPSCSKRARLRRMTKSRHGEQCRRDRYSGARTVVRIPGAPHP